jgi:L-fuconate dehydratase
VEKGRYVAPLDPGFSAQMRPETLQHFVFPEGLAWVGDMHPRLPH